MSKSYSVLIIDMARYDPEEDYMVGDFESLEEAKAYARNRVRSSVEELRAPNQSPADLRLLWHIFGEDATVIGGEERYAGSHELDHFIANPQAARE